MLKQVKSLTAIAMALSALGGCSEMREPIKTDSQFRAPRQNSIPDGIVGLDGRNDGILRIPVPGNMLSASSTDGVGAWPGIGISNVSIPADLSFESALDLVIFEARNGGWHPDIGVVIRNGEAAGKKLNRIKNISGSFEDVVRRLAENADIHVAWRDGAVEVDAAGTYVVPLPPIYDKTAADSVQSTITSLISSTGATLKPDGREARSDQGARTLTYTATQRQQTLVESYLNSLREKPILMFQSYLWDVTIKDKSELGINVKKLGRDIGPLSAGTTANGILSSTVGPTTFTNGFSTGVTLLMNKISIDVLATALREQGDIKSISKPQISILSGTHGLFKNGGKERIIAEVTQQSLVTGTTVTSLPSAAKTEDITVGVTLEVDGDVYGDTIWGNVSVTTEEITDRPTSTINGAQIVLPVRANREVKAPIRALPGQTLLLGGAQTTKRTVRKQGMTTFFGMMPLPGDDLVDEQLSELIVVIQPTLVVFEYPPKPKYASTLPARHELPMGEASPAPVLSSSSSAGAPEAAKQLELAGRDFPNLKKTPPKSQKKPAPLAQKNNRDGEVAGIGHLGESEPWVPFPVLSVMP